MMDEFIHWPKPYPLLSATSDEMLSWMIEMWMKNHLVSDSNCNTVNLYPPNFIYLFIYLKIMTTNVGLACSVGDTTLRFTLSIEQEK